MRHIHQAFTILALSAVLLFASGSVDARSERGVVADGKANAIRVARNDRGDRQRHENRSRRDYSRDHRNDRGRPERDHKSDRRYSPQPNGHRYSDRHNHRDDRAKWPDRSWQKYDSRRGYWRDYHSGHRHGYNHRYYNGYHYYYNQAGFFFPGYGYIAYGHVHSSLCPHWHFEPFATALILGAILSY